VEAPCREAAAGSDAVAAWKEHPCREEALVPAAPFLGAVPSLAEVPYREDTAEVDCLSFRLGPDQPSCILPFRLLF